MQKYKRSRGLRKTHAGSNLTRQTVQESEDIRIGLIGQLLLLFSVLLF